MMRRVLLMITTLLMLSCTSALCEEIQMDIYAIDPCGGCAGAQRGCKACTIIDEMAVRYRMLFPEDRVNIRFYNLRLDNSHEPYLKERLSGFGLDYKDVQLPVVFVGEHVFLADGSMDEAIYDYVKTGATSDIHTLLREKQEYEASLLPGRIVYLYSSYCEDCKDISKWLTYSVPYGYELVKYDIYTDVGLEMESYYLSALDIPPDEYCVPLIIYGEYWFAGKESIYLSLKSRIQEFPDERTVIYEEIPQTDSQDNQ